MNKKESVISKYTFDDEKFRDYIVFRIPDADMTEYLIRRKNHGLLSSCAELNENEYLKDESEIRLFIRSSLPEWINICELDIEILEAGYENEV